MHMHATFDQNIPCGARVMMDLGGTDGLAHSDYSADPRVVQ